MRRRQTSSRRLLTFFTLVIFSLLLGCRVCQSSAKESVEIDDMRLFNLGNSQYASGDLLSAVTSFQQAIARSPTIAAYHSNLGSALHAAGRLDEALAAHDSAIELDPTRARSLYNRGVCLYAMGRLEDAVQAFSQTLAVEVGYVNAAYNLGVAQQERGDLVAAAHAYARTVQLDPLHADARLNYCNVYAALDTNAAAEEVVEKCYLDLLRLHTGFTSGKISLAGLYHRSSRPEDHILAIELYREVLTTDPSNAMATHGLAALTGEWSKSADNDGVHAAYIRDLFDSYSSHFDASLHVLQYKAPAILAEKVRLVDADFITSGGLYSMLDLGAGTGLACLALRPLLSSATAVDLSSKMLTKAAALQCYDSTHVAEVTSFVCENSLDVYGLVVAADVFVYMSQLEALFACCGRVMRHNALFAFTVESLDEDDTADTTGAELCTDKKQQCRQTSKLLPTGRYAHSSKYIEQVASASGFRVELVEKCEPREDRGKPIKGLVFVLRKSEKP